MIKRRAMVGWVIIAAWLVGLGLLARREFFRPEIERLAEAALRVQPGAVYYGVMQGNRQIGFASSTIDTAETTLIVADYFVANIPLGGQSHRATARTNVTLTRALRVLRFDLSLDTEGAPIRAEGKVDGDSLLILAIASGTARPDTQRIKLTGPVLLPTLVPLTLALGDRPKIGKHYDLPIFDPSKMAREKHRPRHSRRIRVRRERQLHARRGDGTLARGEARYAAGVEGDRRLEWRILRLDRRAGTYRLDHAARVRAAPAAVRSRIRELANRHRRGRRRGPRHSRDHRDRRQHKAGQAICRSWLSHRRAAR